MKRRDALLSRSTIRRPRPAFARKAAGSNSVGSDSVIWIASSVSDLSGGTVADGPNREIVLDTPSWPSATCSPQLRRLFSARRSLTVSSHANAKAVQFCSGTTGQPLILRGEPLTRGMVRSSPTEARPSQRQPQPSRISIFAKVLILLRVSPHWLLQLVTSGKGRFPWRRRRTLHLTRPLFWRMLDLDEGSSD